MKNPLKRHYHWVIMLLVSLAMAAFGGFHNSLNVFIIPICEDLGVSRGSYAVTEIPYRISCAAATLVSVVMYRMVGFRRTSVAALCLAAASLTASALCHDLTMLCVCRVVMGIGYGMTITTGAVWAVKTWFARYQGTLIGMASMFTGLGGSLMTVLLTAWLQRFGWRKASLLSAGLIAGIALCYLLFLRERPNDLGLKPFGYGTVQTEHKKVSTAAWHGLSLKQWSRKPLLYIMLLFTFVSTVAGNMAYSVLVPHFQDQGFSPEQTAAFQSLCLLILAGAKLLCGTVTDRFGARVMGSACVICSIAGQALLGATADPVLCYLGVSLVAVGLCLTAVVPPLLVPSIFGYESADIINSISMATVSVACIFSSLIANFGFDRFGSYSPSFMGAAVANLAMLAVYYLMFAMANKERKKVQE